MSRSKLPTGSTIRKICAVLILTAAAFGLLFSGTAADKAAEILASLQLFPAAGRTIAAALSGFVIGIGILLFSGIFGRWYCAGLCPLGTLQDLTFRLKKKGRSFTHPVPFLRWSIFTAVIVLAAAGATGIASLVDPWSIFSRFFTHDLQNLLRYIKRKDIPDLDFVSAAVSGLSFLAVLVLSLRNSRWFCGNICPAGTVLGLLNRTAPLRVQLDRKVCISCGACASVCRASCIEINRKYLDYTRCVNCLECIAVCPAGAVYYGLSRTGGTEKKPQRSRLPGISRARFLLAAAGGISAVAAAGISRHLFSRTALYSGSLPVLPPGAGSADRFLNTCIACGLCIDRCPSKVLQPASLQLGISGLMAPVLDYSVSYCQYDCTLCTDLCPSGALAKLDIQHKHTTKIGNANLVKENCIVFTNRTRCGACAEHCPTGAVRMVTGETGLPEPVFTSSICIGCGACHHACPVTPEQAITVSGLKEQSVAEKPPSGLFDTESTGGEPEGGNAFPF